MIMDRLKYPRYTEDMNWYPDKPYELKHVYDAKQDKYVNNESQCCFYSPTSKHEFCTHKDNCIFNDDKWEYYDEKLNSIVVQIRNIRQLIEEYEHIKYNFLNDEIIYHDTLEECYTIHKTKNSDEKFVINVEVVPNFKNIINIRINNLKGELRELNRVLLRFKRRR